MDRAEILAPAGDAECALAAINAGADAIYLGLSSFSARSGAANFDFGALENLIARAHLFGVKIYVAMNTLIKNSELSDFVNSAVKVHNLGADALIIQDIYLGAYLKKQYPQMCLHLSTQAGICNEYGARYAKELGFSRVILARETKIADVKKIAEIIETEVFVQGALCTCFSGQCYMSSFAGGNSGNRGKCKQPCRKRYKIDRAGFDDYAYRISLSDLCAGENLKSLMSAGAASLKIEGRMRRPEYVAAAVGYYKKLLDGGDQKEALSALKRTYNRGNYTKGLAFGQDKSLISASVQGHLGEYAGIVRVENGKYVCSTEGAFGAGDGFKILRGGSEIGGASFGEKVKGGFTLKTGARLKNGDKVFITTDAELAHRLLSEKRVYKLSVSAYFKAGENPKVCVGGREFAADFVAEAAHGRPLTKDDFIACFNKIDAYPYEIEYGEIDICDGVFVAVSRLNAFRRAVYNEIFIAHIQNGRDKIEKIFPLPEAETPCKNDKKAVIARSLCGLNADIGILKMDCFTCGLSEAERLSEDFKGEKFIYLPPYFSGEDIERVKPLISLFDGIYCGGNYAVPLAKELNKKLFAGVGFNLFNSLAVDMCPAEYVALSKELTAAEARPLSRHNAFYLTAGDVQVMDLIYCPFGVSCRSCDKKHIYTLTDENGREFPMRRYETVGGCRFELFNCAPLVSANGFTGTLAEFTCQPDVKAAESALGDADKLKRLFVSYTKGHTENPVL